MSPSIAFFLILGFFVSFILSCHVLSLNRRLSQHEQTLMFLWKTHLHLNHGQDQREELPW